LTINQRFVDQHIDFNQRQRQSTKVLLTQSINPREAFNILKLLIDVEAGQGVRRCSILQVSLSNRVFCGAFRSRRNASQFLHPNMPDQFPTDAAFLEDRSLGTSATPSTWKPTAEEEAYIFKLFRRLLAVRTKQ
jgi:hypothetical protein